MEIGIDSFAAVDITKGPPSSIDRVKAISELIDRIVYADEVGIDFLVSVNIIVRNFWILHPI